MAGLTGLGLAHPWALLGLLALPLLWWLLHLVPPRPRLLAFPAVRLLAGLSARDETPAAAPWWLLALRLLAASLLIVAAAGPILNPQQGGSDQGPLIVVIDDDWAAARDWPARKRAMGAVIGHAVRDERPVYLVTTADDPGKVAEPLSAVMAHRRADALVPRPWPTDRSLAIGRLPDLPADSPAAQVVWFSNGLDSGQADILMAALRRLGDVTLHSDLAAHPVLMLRPPVAEGAGLKVRVERIGGGGAADVIVRASDDAGVGLATLRLSFAADDAAAEAMLELPAELRGRLSRLSLVGETSAGAVALVDDRWRRRPVGLLSVEEGERQPLLDFRHYLENALTPATEVRLGDLDDLLARDLAMLLLADRPVNQTEAARLEQWVDGGGVLVQFAGPNLARTTLDGGAPPLLPVPLMAGDRSLSGALSWSKPLGLAPFVAPSPFAGLEGFATPPADVVVRRQVLARPSAELAERTWARLTDGTPLVTAKPMGQGWAVLFHVTATPDWSNLPLSGLFPAMLESLRGLGRGVAVAAAEKDLPLAPVSVMDGFGQLAPAGADRLSLPAQRLLTGLPDRDHPPGLYGDAMAPRAFNLTANFATPNPLARPPGDVLMADYRISPERPLAPWLIGLLIAVLLLDLLISLRFRGLVRASAAALVLAVGLAGPAVAQDRIPQDRTDRALMASLDTRLGYVLTGDARIDATSRDGMRGLALVLRRRTSVELGEAIAVDPEVDDLAFYPMIYWPMPGSSPPLSEFGVQRVEAYLRHGGLILFDTLDGGDPGRAMDLQRLGRQLSLPPLVPADAEHLLARTFYLLGAFPGRFTTGVVWVGDPQAVAEGAGDPVSPVVLGSNDWAAAWAVDDALNPTHALVPGGERQRELARRFGINLVMYALTGTYKADQVHTDAILDRLENRGGPR